jgi:hypothetical protein
MHCLSDYNSLFNDKNDLMEGCIQSVAGFKNICLVAFLLCLKGVENLYARTHACQN